jgi:hypothetical protein
VRDDSDPQRDAIHERLQETGPIGLDEGKAAVLTGWVVVAEWMDEDGGKWLAKCHSASLTTWTAAGFHQEALHGTWPDPKNDED